jgi:hypothetical protein
MAKQPVKQEVYDDEDERPDYDDVYNIPVSQLTKQKPIPTGTYLGQVRGLPEELTSPVKGTKFAQYTIQLLEPAQNDRGNNKDVDPKALEEALTRPNGDVIPLTEKSLRLRMWRTQDSGHRHVDFLEKLGIPTENDDGSERTLPDMIAESPGRTAYFHVKHSPSLDRENIYAEIDRIIKVPQR